MVGLFFFGFLERLFPATGVPAGHCRSLSTHAAQKSPASGFSPHRRWVEKSSLPVGSFGGIH